MTANELRETQGNISESILLAWDPLKILLGVPETTMPTEYRQRNVTDIQEYEGEFAISTFFRGNIKFLFGGN